MDIESRLSISFYNQIATLSEAHKIYIVQHAQTGKIYVKKILDVYNKDVYSYLISHPIEHTPRIYEIYEEDNNLTVIEEYISGDTIEEMLEKDIPLSDEQIRSIVYKLCKIVKDLHECKPAIIHRDIKPSNIIMSTSNEIYLLDFNAAKYHNDDKSEDTTLLGTKGYAAPEQYGFGFSTPQTDIYAIGMLLKDLTNHLSYTSKTNPTTDITGTNNDNTNPDYTGPNNTGSNSNNSNSTGSNSICPNNTAKNEFAPIIKKCTQLNPHERYKNITALMHVLYRVEPPVVNPTKKLPSWMSYLPPGFQKLSPVHMILAIAGYGVLTYLCTWISFDSATSFGVIFGRAYSLLMFLTIIFFSANYRNVHSIFPLCKSKNKLVKTLGIIIFDILIFFAFVCILAGIYGVLTPLYQS